MSEVIEDRARLTMRAALPEDAPYAESAAPPIRGSAVAYFFKNGRYVRYNLLSDSVDVGPAAVSTFWPRLPPFFQERVDAIVNWGNGKVYFFRDGRYLRYNLPTDRPDFDDASIAVNWPTLPDAFKTKIDAAVNWGNGIAYFFRQDKYVRYNIAQDRVEYGPADIGAAWTALPAEFHRDLDAVVHWGNDRAYFFKGSRYVRYDTTNDTVDVGPTSIAQNWTSLPAEFQAGISAAVNWTQPCNLARLMESAGLPVVEVPGWETNGRPGTFAPEGIVFHHTAGTAPGDLNVVIRGRAAVPATRTRKASPALPGPLANFYVGRDGALHVVSKGVSNHAGSGAQRVLDELRRGVAPSDTAARRGLANGPSGNGVFYGFENENLGTGQDWPDAQVDTIARACAALCQLHGWNANRIIAHKEWTDRKIDPVGIDMADFRRRVTSFF
ncbi:MAG: hemopexin repeat-containing protein [Burkholderiaceae bacterium]